MKKIQLTNGGFAVIDDRDFNLVNKYKWLKTSHNYAGTTVLPRIYMHRLINNTPEGFDTDHINRNTLDNQRNNLRTCGKGLNAINTNLRKTNTSGHKGISWDKKMKKWQAYIWKEYKKIHLGYFTDIKKAIKARLEAEKLYHSI